MAGALALWSAAATHGAKHEGAAEPSYADQGRTAADSEGRGGPIALVGVLVAFALVAGILWFSFWAFDADDPFDAGVTVEHVADDPASLAGQSVVLFGEVEEQGDGGFVLEGEDGAEVVILTEEDVTLLDDERVQVYGVVHERNDLPGSRDFGEEAGEGAVAARFVDATPLLNRRRRLSERPRSIRGRIALDHRLTAYVPDLPPMPPRAQGACSGANGRALPAMHRPAKAPSPHVHVGACE